MELRTALFGKEVSKFKQDEDEYSITLRYNKATRGNINALLNLLITYREIYTGQVRSIPLSTTRQNICGRQRLTEAHYNSIFQCIVGVFGK
jgi:Cu/Ag efflux pump CusA